jgi:hypothetical protein
MWKCEILISKILKDVIELEDSDSNDGKDNGADLAIIAVDLSDEEVEDGQGAKVSSSKSKIQAMKKARGTEDGRWRSCRGAVEEQVSLIGKRGNHFNSYLRKAPFR